MVGSVRGAGHAYRLRLAEGFSGGSTIVWSEPDTGVGTPRLWRREPGVSMAARALVGLLRLLPIESQL